MLKLGLIVLEEKMFMVVNIFFYFAITFSVEDAFIRESLALIRERFDLIREKYIFSLQKCAHCAFKVDRFYKLY